jgi:predicted ATPase
MAAARAHCYADATNQVYAPIAAWLRSHVLLASFHTLDQIWLSELARILPELLTSHPTLPPPGPLSERWQQARFHEALTRAIATRNEPLLLFLDDIQWCDAETLTFIPSLLRAASTSRLLIVATLRGEDIDRHHPISTFRPALQWDGAWTEVALAPLSVEDTVALAAQTVGQPLSHASAEWMYRETEGNPLFIVEFANAHRQAMSVQQLNRHGPEPITIPTAIQSVIETRIAQLTPYAQGLVNAAAVVGRAFSTTLLTHILDAPDEDMLVRGLDELWQRRIIRE